MPISWTRRTAAQAAVAVVTAGCVAWAGAIPAAAGLTPVRPRQHFIGLVNGRAGRPHRVAIQMACFGATKPGQTGHPMGHQTIAVVKVGGRHTPAGYTGSGTSIGAFFGAPPPAAGSAGHVLFRRYRTKALPVSLVLPCSGTGTVTFVALPRNPRSRSFRVPVSFAGQP